MSASAGAPGDAQPLRVNLESYIRASRRLNTLVIKTISNRQIFRTKYNVKKG